MENKLDSLALYVAIVPEGRAKTLIRIAKENHLSGATVFLGKGTTSKGILAFFCIDNPKREIIWMAGMISIGDKAMAEIAKTMHFDKRHQGIIYSAKLANIIGCSRVSDNAEGKEPLMSEYQAIYTIVEKGNAEQVLESASKAGATGGTIVNARGSGIHETEKIFQMAIEPEKEVVLILAKTEDVLAITDSIRKDLQIDKPGKGIIFVQDVRNTYGLFEKKTTIK